MKMQETFNVHFLWRKDFESPAKRGVALKQGAAFILLLSLAQRKKQRNIHPNQTFPYIGRLNQKVAEADDFLTVLVSRDTR